MLLKKADYEKLVKRIESLEKENKSLKTKYEGKISSELNMKEYKKEVDRKAKEEVEAYKKNLNALVEKDFNYAFLQALVNNAAKGVCIDVKSDKGYSLTIRREEKQDSNDLDLYGMLGIKN